MKKRDYNLDLIKFIAIIATISIHVLSAGSRADLFSKLGYFLYLQVHFLDFVCQYFVCVQAISYIQKKKLTLKVFIKRFLNFLFILYWLS